MNAFWKSLVVSIAIYQLVLSYCMIYLADYCVWLRFGNGTNLLNTYPGRMSALFLGGVLAALVVFNLAMLFRAARPSQNG
jgi:hypothetical protein